MGHPTLCSTRRFEKAFDHVDRNKALHAMKQHAVGKQHLAWISKLREQHGLEMWLGHFTSRTFKTTRGAPKRSAREPNGVHSTGGHSACSSEKMVRKRDILQLQTGLVVFFQAWHMQKKHTSKCDGVLVQNGSHGGDGMHKLQTSKNTKTEHQATRTDNTGCLQTAQDRETWKDNEQ